MADNKLILAGTKVTTYASNAVSDLTYFVDMGQVDPANADAELLRQAQNDFPFVGQIPPDLKAIEGVPDVLHQMRIQAITTSFDFTNNACKAIVQLHCESRPQPTFEFDASGQQTKGDTYLSDDEGSLFLPDRKQMVLDYLLKKGSAFTDPATGVSFPLQDFPLPPVPLEASVLRFGATCRLNATYYTDEIARKDLLAATAYYTPTSNSEDLFFVGDQGHWLLMAFPVSTLDGGWTMKIGAEFVYSPDGWDTVGVYTNGFTKQKVLISDENLKKISPPLINPAGDVCDPVLPDQAGIGRWPQVRQIPHAPVLKFLLQETLNTTYQDAAAEFVASLQRITTTENI